MAGDGESQPAESVDALSDLAAALEPKEPESKEKVAAEADDEESEAEESEADDESSEESDDEEESEDAEPDPTVKLKHDGKEVEMKLSEAITLAQQGFDYSKKTMAVAEERKAIEAERAQVKEVRKQHDDVLGESLVRLRAMAKVIEAEIGEPPPVVLASQNAGHYIALKEQHEARKGKFAQAMEALRSIEQEQVRKRDTEFREKSAATEKALVDTLPGWNESKFNELCGYAEKIGLTPDNARDAMLEPGFWQLAEKARQFDAIQARKSEMKPKAKLTPVIKPQGTQTPSRQAADRVKREAEFNKNPSVDALANLLK